MQTRTALVLALLAAPALAAAAPADRARSQSAVEKARALGSPGVRLGAVTSFGSASPDTLTAVGGGAYYLFDIPGLLADVSADAFAGDGARFVAGGLGAYYPFLDEETTPYLGGGLRMGWTKFGGDGAFGLHPFAAAGVLFGRSWRPQIRLEIAYFVTTGGERRGPGFEERHANGPVATFGIGF